MQLFNEMRIVYLPVAVKADSGLVQIGPSVIVLSRVDWVRMMNVNMCSLGGDWRANLEVSLRLEWVRSEWVLARSHEDSSELELSQLPVNVPLTAVLLTEESVLNFEDSLDSSVDSLHATSVAEDHE